MSDKVDFVGFIPTNKLLTKAKTMIWKVEEQAPSQSAQHATISKTPLGFEGLIKINWSKGSFEVNSSSETPEALIKELLKLMTTDLNKWKKNRV